jgi:transcriptional regulator with XRE-family HTH domain
MSKGAKDPAEFGVRLKRLRRAAGLTQEALSKKSGVSRVQIATYEAPSGRANPTQETVEALAGALGVRGTDLTESVVGVTTGKAAVDIYMASPWPQIDRPSSDEVGWLASLPDVVWIGVTPTAEAVHHMVMARRAAAVTGK